MPVVFHRRGLRQPSFFVGPQPSDLPQPTQSLRRRIGQILPFAVRELRHLPNDHIRPSSVRRKDHLLCENGLHRLGARHLVALWRLQINREGVIRIKPPQLVRCRAATRSILIIRASALKRSAVCRTRSTNPHLLLTRCR